MKLHTIISENADFARHLLCGLHKILSHSLHHDFFEARSSAIQARIEFLSAQTEEWRQARYAELASALKGVVKDVAKSFPALGTGDKDQDVATLWKMEMVLFNEKFALLKNDWLEKKKSLDNWLKDAEQESNPKKKAGIEKKRRDDLRKATEKLELCLKGHLPDDAKAEDLESLQLFPELPEAYTNKAGRDMELRAFELLAIAKEEQNQYVTDPATNRAHEVDILRTESSPDGRRFLIEVKSNSAALTSALGGKLTALAEATELSKDQVFAMTKKWIDGRLNLRDATQIVIDKFVKSFEFSNAHVQLMESAAAGAPLEKILTRDNAGPLAKALEQALNHLVRKNVTLDDVLANPELSRAAEGWRMMTDEEVLSELGVDTSTTSDLVFWKLA